MSMLTIDTKYCGNINIHIEGSRSTNEVALMTVHDIGCNHHQFLNFIKDPSMNSLGPRCVWFNVDLPGQGSDDKDLPENFHYPSLAEIASDLLECVGKMNISHLILFGDGAGANIIARMVKSGDERILGAVLLNCVGTTSKFVDALKDKMISWKLSSIGMNSKTENYLVAHRFGVKLTNTHLFQKDYHRVMPTQTYVDAADLSMSKTKSDAELCSLIEQYKNFIRQTINARNLHGYVNSYMHRSNLIDKDTMFRCPVLFVVGTLANSYSAVKCLYEDVISQLKSEPDRKRLIELMEVDECANVLVERPDRVAESLQYFLQGIGLVSSVPSRRMSNTVRPQAGRKMSMEEFDNPKGVPNLVYHANRKYSESEH